MDSAAVVSLSVGLATVESATSDCGFGHQGPLIVTLHPWHMSTVGAAIAIKSDIYVTVIESIIQACIQPDIKLVDHAALLSHTKNHSLCYHEQRCQHCQFSCLSPHLLGQLSTLASL